MEIDPEKDFPNFPPDQKVPSIKCAYSFAIPLLTIERSQTTDYKTIKRIEKELAVSLLMKSTTPHFMGFGNGSCRITGERSGIYRAVALLVALVRLSSPERYCYWTHWIDPQKISPETDDQGLIEEGAHAPNDAQIKTNLGGKLPSEDDQDPSELAKRWQASWPHCPVWSDEVGDIKETAITASASAIQHAIVAQDVNHQIETCGSNEETSSYQAEGESQGGLTPATSPPPYIVPAQNRLVLPKSPNSVPPAIPDNSTQSDVRSSASNSGPQEVPSISNTVGTPAFQPDASHEGGISRNLVVEQDLVKEDTSSEKHKDSEILNKSMDLDATASSFAEAQEEYEGLIKNVMELPLEAQEYLSRRRYLVIREVIQQSQAFCRLSVTPNSLKFLAAGREEEVSLAMLLISLKLRELSNLPFDKISKM